MISDYKCLARPIAHNTYHLNISSTYRQKATRIEIHLVLYHRYNTYQKFLIDRWEDLCSFLNGSNSEMVLIAFYNPLLQYTNAHPSPNAANETYYLAANRSKMK